MSRPAAYLTSSTGHIGTVVEGSPDALVNGKPSAAVEHAVKCPKHGKSAIVGGRRDVLVNNRPMARLLDKVLCAGASSSSKGALADHGTPDGQIGGHDIHLDGQLEDVPQAELDALLEALESGDPVAIEKAWRKLPHKAQVGRLTIKVVDPQNPNAWTEYELTGPGAQNAPLNPGVTAPEWEAAPGGGRVRWGGGTQAVGVKKTKVARRVEPDGSVVERREGIAFSASEGASIEGELSDKRKGISFDTPWIVGGSIEEITISPPGSVNKNPAPALDDILFPVSHDVLVGD